MCRRVLLTVSVLAGSLFLLAGLTPRASTLMSAEPATDDPFAAPVPTDDPFAAPVPTNDPSAVPILNDSAGLPTRSAESAILKALAAPTTLDFVEEPLQGVVDYFIEEHDIQIVIDLRGLEDVNIGSDVPITRTLSGISLRSALDLVLRDLDLTWTIYSEVLLITTPDDADLLQTTKTYDVGDLVVCQDEDGRPWDDYGSLIDIITWTVAPDSWEVDGGPVGYTFASAKVLVIRQTCQVHLEIAQLLDTIRKVGKAHGTDAEPPVRPSPFRGRAGCTGGFGGGIQTDATTGKPADAAENPFK